ncbi:MAG: 30S ribosomal protein S27ae [Thermoprotei archaeon]
MSQTHKQYEVDYKTMTLKTLNKSCPRCGSHMAHHKQGVNRWACGRCGYTEYMKSAK